MIARIWGWLRGAGSWVLGLLAAIVPIIVTWHAYRMQRARAEDAEARAARATEALAIAIEAGRARAEALKRADAQLSEIHVAYARDRSAITALHDELTRIAGPDAAAGVWDRAFGRVPEEPAAIARERSIAP